MQRFYLDGKTVLSIDEYKDEYKGHIFCEDPICRQPIKLVPATNKQIAYFRIVCPFKHHPDCDAGSKHPRVDPDVDNIKLRNRYHRTHKLPPVLTLNPQTLLAPQKGDENIDALKDKKMAVKNITKGAKTGSKREYLNDLDSIAKFVRTYYPVRETVQFTVGNELKYFNEVILNPDYIQDNTDILSGKYVYLVGRICEFKVHDKVPHVSFYLDNNLGTGNIRIFINSRSLPNVISDRQFRGFIGHLVFTYGKVEKVTETLPVQVTVHSLKKIYTIK